MPVIDYYAESVLDKVAYSAGRGVKTVTVVSEKLNPLKGAFGVAALWGSFSGIVNYRRYKKGRLSKGDAIKVTTSESVGMGISAGMGLLVSNALRTSLMAVTTTSALPFAAGVGVTGLVKVIWDCKTKKNMMWCGCRRTSETNSVI